MIEFEIDNKKVQVNDGAMIIEAADAAGIYIPRFCYHKKLSIAANCRMCLVEVEKSKKPLPACATPATSGMKVFTKSKLAVDAQRSVMEFLLINHPLDCPICDQGGECELQDLSLGYGNDISRYNEGKRSVYDENLGPLISTDMTRCIQCTRCVRFGNEIAGLPELGTTSRGEELEISTYVHHTMRSELSGNVIDLCPVGALTNKPYRFTARAWELVQHPSVAPHDCVGSNIFVHTRGYVYNDYQQVMRVVPRENESINETWISDRDRYSYQAVNSTDRLLSPRIKRESEWVTVDWQTALNYVVERWQHIVKEYGPQEIGALASPNSTIEEFFLLQKLLRNLGTSNIDHRIRQLDFSQQENFPLCPELGMGLTAINKMKKIFLIGSDVRREQPLACHHIRKAALQGANVISLNPINYEMNFQLSAQQVVPSEQIPQFLMEIARHLTPDDEIDPLLRDIVPSEAAIKLAEIIEQEGDGAIILGIHALEHPKATLIRSLAEYIAERYHLTVGSLTEGANAAGAWLAGMVPHRGPAGSLTGKTGFSALQMLENGLKCYVLLNIEPELDVAKPAVAMRALANSEFNVVFTPFVTSVQEQYADVLLPITPFFETPGNFVNAMKLWQKFEAVTRPLGDSKPAWKVLRVLGNLLGFEGFDYHELGQVTTDIKNLLNTIPANPTRIKLEGPTNSTNSGELIRLAEWPMYQVDNFVRRAVNLQAWSEEENLVAARINQGVADEYGIQSGELVSFIQDDAQIDLPVFIDDRIAGGYVLIHAGILPTAGFGENMGTIKIMRERSR